jgi:shikimate dehydrogenase
VILLGLLGWPVAHSLSPAMQHAALRALGLDGTYTAFAVPPDRLADAVRGAAALGFTGLNVTLPHKEAALALCAPDPLARRVGAVNTLVFQGDGIQGLNTDVHGFARLAEEAGARIAGARALVLGAGGAARAVAAALLDGGAAVTVASRSARRVRIDGETIACVPWEAIGPALAGTDLLVDATPRGIAGGEAIDLTPLPAAATVLDLAARASTPLVDAARARGLAAQAGLAMLLHQGGRALEAWTGRPAPIDAMRAALPFAPG